MYVIDLITIYLTFKLKQVFDMIKNVYLLHNIGVYISLMF